MTQVLFEYEGPRFDAEQSGRFAASVGRDYYSADCRVLPDAESFLLRNSRSWAGDIPISEHRCVGARADVRRSARQVAGSDVDIFLVWIPVRGTVSISQHGRTAVIGRGTVAISSSRGPLCIVTAPDALHEHLSYQVTVPAALVTAALSDPERYCAVAHGSEQGGAHVARELFLSLYEEAANVDERCGEALARSALAALLRSMAGEQADEQASEGRELKLQRVLDYLELHLSDPGLTTDKVAAACGISTRYLHYLLKSRGLKFHDRLWQSRLDSAFRQLTNPALAGRNIADVAYAAGFKSSAHFSRAFQHRFGCSPRQARLTGRAARRPSGGE